MFASTCARLPGISRIGALALTFALTTSIPAFARAAGQDSATVEVHGGTVTFDTATNVSAISVHGKSTALDGRARVQHTEQGLTIEQLEASVPIASLATGMGLRDSHMRKYVFTTADGQTPDLRLDVGHAACAHAGGREMTCQLSGSLAMRGTPRPFTMTLKVIEAGGVFHASGDAEVKLSDWQIERPSQLGVQTADEIKLHLEFVGRPAATLTTAYRDGR